MAKATSKQLLIASSALTEMVRKVAEGRLFQIIIFDMAIISWLIISLYLRDEPTSIASNDAFIIDNALISIYARVYIYFVHYGGFIPQTMYTLSHHLGIDDIFDCLLLIDRQVSIDK